MRLINFNSKLTYKKADQFLGAKQKRGLNGSNTYMYRDGDTIKVRLYSTDILTFYKNRLIEINCGSWFTQLTKKRISQLTRINISSSDQYEGPIIYEWPSRLWYRFENGIKLSEEGTIITGGKPCSLKTKSLP